MTDIQDEVDTFFENYKPVPPISKKPLMTKVWVVTEGDYADYHIVGVFSSKEKAIACADQIDTWHGANVEEYAVDTIVLPGGK